MNISPDSNVFLRSIVRDNPAQARIADEILASADTIAVSLMLLCEIAWVLRRVYRLSPMDVSAAIRRIVNSKQVGADRQAISAGLALAEAGGDFADGVIAYEGRRLGGATFVTFDQKAARLLEAQGYPVKHLG